MAGITEQFKSLADIITVGKHALEGIFNEISNGITITDEHSRVIYVNPAFSVITGYSAQDIIGDNPGLLHSGRHDKTFYQHMWSDIQQLGRWQGEIWNRHKDGRIIPELLTITKLVNDQQQIYYIGIFSDISKITLQNEKNLDLALRDPLTRLCNRALLEERFKDIVSQYKRCLSDHQGTPEQAALLFIDINHFKQLNDTHGHLVGDSMLVLVASILETCSRDVDTVARVGGDEFVILLPRAKSRENVEHYCNRIYEKMNESKKTKEGFLVPTISIGASFFPSEASNYETLMTNADKAMYFAKRHQLYLTFYSDL